MQAACEFGLLSKEGISGHTRYGLARAARSGRQALQVKDHLLDALIGGDDHRALAALRVRAIR